MKHHEHNNNNNQPSLVRLTLNSKADKPVALISGSNWNLACWFLWREKNLHSRDKNQHQNQPTYESGSQNRTWATAVGGEHSHHCAIPAFPKHEHEHKMIAYKKQFILNRQPNSS